MDFNKEILNYIKPEYIDECKARMGASFKVYPSKTKIGFLVLGINPAGDEKDTIFEKQDNYFYLNFIEGFKKNKYTSPVYFKQVYVLAEKVFDKVKWDWCNLSSKELEHYLDINDFSLNEKDKIRKHFIGHKDNFVTIYIGDLFYIHETSQNILLKWIKTKDISDYVKRCLDEHISLIKNAGVEELIIYVNNAKASEYINNAISDGKPKSKTPYKSCKIFFGSMISGQRAMDVFSKERLIHEIRSNAKEVNKRTIA